MVRGQRRSFRIEAEVLKQILFSETWRRLRKKNKVVREKGIPRYKISGSLNSLEKKQKAARVIMENAIDTALSTFILTLISMLLFHPRFYGNHLRTMHFIYRRTV